MSASQILPFLWVGGKSAAKDREFLDLHNIRYVINMTNTRSADPESGVHNFFEKDPIFKYARFPLLDNTGQAILSTIPSVLDTIDSFKHYGNILIHCNQGVSRSVAMVIAYLIRSKSMSYDDAFLFVAANRPHACRPNPRFVGDLKTFAIQMQQKRKATSKYPSSAASSSAASDAGSVSSHGSRGRAVHGASSAGRDRAMPAAGGPVGCAPRPVAAGAASASQSTGSLQPAGISDGMPGSKRKRDETGSETAGVVGAGNDQSADAESIGPQMPPHLRSRAAIEDVPDNAPDATSDVGKTGSIGPQLPASEENHDRTTEIRVDSIEPSVSDLVDHHIAAADEIGDAVVGVEFSAQSQPLLKTDSHKTSATVTVAGLLEPER